MNHLVKINVENLKYLEIGINWIDLWRVRPNKKRRPERRLTSIFCVRVNQSIQLWFQTYKIQQTIAPFEFGTKLSIQFVSIHWIVQLILFFLDGMQIIKTRQPKFFALFLWSMNSILSLIIHRMPFQISRNGLTCAHFDQFQKYEIV